MVKNKDEDGYEKGKRDMKWWEDWLAGKERGQRKGRTDYVQVGGGQGLASVLFKRKYCSRVLMRSFQKN